MNVGSVQNKDGDFVKPDDDTFQAAAAYADWKAPGMYQILTNQPGKNSWPITGASFILMHTKQDKPQNAAEVLKFFDWAYKNGGKLAEELDYVPMPEQRCARSSRPLEDRNQGRVRQGGLELTSGPFRGAGGDRSQASSARGREPSFATACRSGEDYHGGHVGNRCISRTHDRATRARPEREPNPPAQRQAAGQWQDWLFERTTLFFAVFVLATLLFILLALGYSAIPAFEKFGFGVLHDQRLESGQERIRRARADLRDAGHVADRAADRRAGEFRHCAVPDRNVPGGAQAAAGNGGGAARRHPVDHLRHVGALRVRADFRRLHPARAHQDFRQPLDPGAAVPGRARTASACCPPESSCPS